MNIHEYQAKALLHEFGVPISRGVPVLRAADSDVAAKTLGGPVWVVKSQIHAGGRGKGKFKEASAGDKGGVRIAKSVAEVNEFAKQMLGATLVTVQTGPHGKQVNRLYVEEGSDIDKEFYLSILVNRETSKISFVVSTEGGVNIEDVAHSTPEKIVTFSVDPATGIMAHHGRIVGKALGLAGDLAKQAERLGRRRQGKGHCGIQDHHRRSQCEGHPGQYFRRHHEMRYHRRGRGRGGEGSRPESAAGGAAGGHQRRRRKEDPPGIRSQRGAGRRPR